MSMKTNISIRLTLVSVVIQVASGIAYLPCIAADKIQNTKSIREEPQVLRGKELGVGQRIPDIQFEDISGKKLRLSDLTEFDAVVVAMTGTGCPLCKKYAPTLARMEKLYRPKNVAFVFVNPNGSEDLEDLNREVQRLDLIGPYVRDDTMAVCRTLGVKTTTEVFVIDRSRTLVYRGAVDDQYGFGYSLDEPRDRYLHNALDSLANRKRPLVNATSAPGCEIFYDQDSNEIENPSVTYYNQVARIINANCIECHRGGGIGPMPFETFEQVKDYAGMIRNVVERGVMPPWFATPQDEKDESTQELAVHWLNERPLTVHEKQQLLEWLETGTPKGNPDDAPLKPAFPDGWLIGEPDAIFQFSKPVPVKASGTMPYKYITVETDLPEDKWIQAIEIRPGQIEVVHHVIVSLRYEGSESDERDGFWGVYVPGNSTLVYPEGMARRLPKGAKLRFQMHYTPNGTATEDLTSIGLVFADQIPDYEVKVRGIASRKLSIPAGSPNHEVSASIPIPFDVDILSFLPHMHLRGKAAKYELVRRNEEDETLLDVPEYDFNWQLVYRLSEPRTLMTGDSIRYTAWYDNSRDNPANPDPNKTVGWGEQTDDEMHLGYVEYTVPVSSENKNSLSKSRGPIAQGIRNLTQNRLFSRLDVNGDGFITRAEVRRKMPNNKDAAGSIFDRLDVDGDEKLNRDELSRL